MALFAKKNSDTAPQNASAGSSKGPKKGLPFGRKKAAAPDPPAPPPAGGVEDFSDFSDFSAQDESAPAAVAAAAPPARGGRAAKPEKKGLKGGAVIGLNIGNDSIKVVELKGKGAQVAVTAVGMAPTPPESISNGVVMSTSALSAAIRDLLKSSGIGTKRVVSSVSGSGALVVRVIEVPQMSDVELKGNMTQDADRYIPFPPSEVIMDFKALRQLPSAPDGNMEVLLAAAQREIVDLHVNVLLGARLDPQSVDVEPLAAARALNYDGLADTPPNVDYNDVSALINIGATSTEITVLRGDLLVFTRSIPRGGHVLTQSIADTLGLAFSDAERLKQDFGDALPPAEGDADLAAGAPDPFGDFSEFAEADTGFGADDSFMVADAGPAQTVDEVTAETDEAWDDFSGFGTGDTDAGGDTGATAPRTTDPFDEEFYNQGPQGGPSGQDPTERHAQKQDDAESTRSAFDFSFDSLDETAQNLPASPGGVPDADNAPLPTLADAAATTRVPEDLEVQPPLNAGQAEAPFVPAANDLDLHSATQPEEIAPSGRMVAFNAMDDPSLPSFPTLPPHLSQLPLEDDFSALPTMTDETHGEIDEEDRNLPMEQDEEELVMPVPAADDEFDALPTMTDETYGEIDEEDRNLPAEQEESAVAEVADAPAPSSSGFSFDFAEPEAAAPTTDELAALAGVGANTEAVSAETAAAPASAAFDLDSLDIPVSSAAAPAAAEAFPGAETPTGDVADEFAAGDFGTDDFAAEAAGIDFGVDDFSFDAGGFGAALVGGEVSDDITADTIYGILHPQLEELVGEVRRSLEYFGSRYPDSGVRRITLVGGGAKLRNIDTYFTSELGIPSTRGNPFGGVPVRAAGGSEYIDENAPLFAVALGLALRDVA